MDEGAAGAVKQAVNRTGEALRVGQRLVSRPTRIEQFLFTPRTVVWVDDRTGTPLGLAAEGYLDVIGDCEPGPREDEGAVATPLGDLQVGFPEARPYRLDVAAVFGELSRHPRAYLADRVPSGWMTERVSRQ